jgi:hypothetical protein
VPIQIRIRSNNQIVHWGTAALARPDISASRRGSSPNVGFGVSFPLDPGDYEFCVDALEGPLTATIGCVRMNVGGGGSVAGSGITGSLPNTAGNDSDGISPAGAPTPSEVVLPVRGALSQSPTLGAVQVIRRSGATTGFVSGWAGDPDVEDAAFIEVSVDGVSTAVIQTDLPRPDVAAAFSGFASTTGFAVTFPLPVGAARVHVVAISPDDGRRQPLGFQDLGPTPQDGTDERAGRPTPSGSSTSTSDVVYGGIDAVDITDAGIAVAGWSFDPNDRDRVITVRAEAAGFKVVSKTGLVNPGAQEIYGVHASCGFELLLVLPAGLHDLSVTAVGANGGTSMIDQRTVAVP